MEGATGTKQEERFPSMTCWLGAALDCMGCVDQSVSREGVYKTITGSGLLFQVLRVVNNKELCDLKPLCLEKAAHLLFFMLKGLMCL